MKIRDLEEKLSKQDSVVNKTINSFDSIVFYNIMFLQIRQQEAAKAQLETQIKNEKDRASKLDKDYEKEKREKNRWESKAADLDTDLSVRFY